MFRTAAIACVFALAAFSQPPLTSDRSKAGTLASTNPGIYPGRAAYYMPPVIDVMVSFDTNVIPLVVQVTVSSSVVQRTVWFNNGIRHTNDLLLASNIVSCVTNAVIK